MYPKFRKLLERTLFGFAYLAISCKLLIPIGYMPAPIGAGGPIAFCPSAGPILPFMQHGLHHGGHAGHEGDDGKLKWEHCPYGALAKSAPLAVAFELSIDHGVVRDVPFFVSTLTARAAVAAFRARAPPAGLA